MVPSISTFDLNEAPESMRIVGEWLLCDDEAIRPAVSVLIVGPDGRALDAAFLIDTGSDRTVFRTAILSRLRLPRVTSPVGVTLAGISGTSPYVSVDAILEFSRDDGVAQRVRGPYSVFTNPDATDISILGRDVLDNFDVLLSRRRDEVLLLSQRHEYRVVRI